MALGETEADLSDQQLPVAVVAWEVPDTQLSPGKPPPLPEGVRAVMVIPEMTNSVIDTDACGRINLAELTRRESPAV